MHESDFGAVPIEVDRGFDRRVFPSDDDDFPARVGMTLGIVMGDPRKPFSGNAQRSRPIEDAGREYDPARF